MNDLQMSIDELLSLPVSVDLVTAGRAFGLGRTKAFELAQQGEFPCRVIRVGIKYRVPRSAILEALGIKPADRAETRAAASAADRIFDHPGQRRRGPSREPEPAA